VPSLPARTTVRRRNAERTRNTMIELPVPAHPSAAYRRRTFRTGPQSERGGTIGCTRELSESRASTQGDVASTRRPRRATMRSITWRTASSPSNRRSATLSMRRFRTTYTSRFCPTLPPGIGGIVASRRWWPDKSSMAAGQVFEPDRPHKSLHVLGRRLKTKTLVTGLETARASDMPSKPVCHTSLG
jgi:hypothetical protein